MKRIAVRSTAIAAAVLLFAWLPAAALPLAPQASTISPVGIIWQVKGQDLIPTQACDGNRAGRSRCTDGANQSEGLIGAAVNSGLTLPPITYRLCGWWNGHEYSKSDNTNCQPGDTLVVENYEMLRVAARNGAFASGGLRAAVYDLENWPATPSRQWRHPFASIRNALGIAHHAGVSLIVTPGGKFAECTECWTTAAQYGALGVAIQSQGWGWDSHPGHWIPAMWDYRTLKAVEDVHAAQRKYHTGTFAMLGLATNTPLVHPLWVLQSEYEYAVSHEHVTRFWMNSKDWGGRNQCTPLDGGLGCPEIAVQFWQREGFTD